MSSRILLAVFLGYSVGQLPDEGLPWSALHLLFVVALLVLMVRALKREHDGQGA